MATNSVSTTTISVFPRHGNECERRADPTWKRCKCRKSLYIYEDGKVTYMSARTRTWEQAEKVAQQERDKRDPVKLELARIAAEEERKKAARQTGLEAALDQWIAGFKVQDGSENAKAYATFKRFLLLWAQENGITLVQEVTADALHAWVGSWGMAPNTQGFRLTKLRTFMRWARDQRAARSAFWLALLSMSSSIWPVSAICIHGAFCGDSLRAASTLKSSR